MNRDWRALNETTGMLIPPPMSAYIRNASRGLVTHLKAEGSNATRTGSGSMAAGGNEQQTKPEEDEDDNEDYETDFQNAARMGFTDYDSSQYYAKLRAGVEGQRRIGLADGLPGSFVTSSAVVLNIKSHGEPLIPPSIDYKELSREHANG
jgi:hypothetical protein